MSRIRVLLADDHAITREGTRQLLEAEAELEVLAEAADGEAALRLTQELRPDILLLDISMPRMSGIEVARVLHRSMPEVKIVILTGYDDNEQYARALLRLGVKGFLSKTARSHELVSALHAVQDGKTYLQSTIKELMRASAALRTQEKPTAREIEVLRLVAAGHRNREIAERLHTSERTVQFHLSNAFVKLNATSRTEAVHMARQLGWIV